MHSRGSTPGSRADQYLTAWPFRRAVAPNDHHDNKKGGQAMLNQAIKMADGAFLIDLRRHSVILILQA